MKPDTQGVRALRLAAAVTACAAFGMAAAQYTGPSSAPAYASVAEILKNPVDDATVELTGYIVRKVGSDKYIFSDGQSQIRVEIDRKVFPTSPINDKTRVRIRGEVEKEFLESPEVDVDVIEVLGP